MNDSFAYSIAFKLFADSIPASATTTRSAPWWRSRNASRTGNRVEVSAVLPSKQCTSSGNPDGSTSNPTWIWGSTRRSLLHTHLAQRVLFLGLEMQGRDVVEDRAQSAAAGGVIQAGGRQLPAVVALLAAREGAPL